MTREEFEKNIKKTDRYAFLEKRLKVLKAAKENLIIEKMYCAEGSDHSIKFEYEESIEVFNQSIKDCIDLEIDQITIDMEEI